MLSQTSRTEILRRINATTGYSISEDSLSPATRQAITNLATVQRHLFVVLEILRGEQSRVEKSAILTMASKLGKDSGRAERAVLTDEVTKLQAEVDAKVSELSKQVLDEVNARQSGQQPPEYKGKLELVQLRCPNCGASLPIPMGHMVQCEYCKSTLSLQDVSAQIKTMIQSI